MDVFLSDSRSPIDNLAMEEALLATCSQPLLFLYENESAIVIGRFQNPWLECNIGTIRRAGIPILRRISGGGTVVHGRGNLNWSVIRPGPLSSKEETLARMVQVLADLGVAINTSAHFDLLIELPDEAFARKVAGSAFRQTARSSLQHATLLVNANLERLKNLLAGPPRQIDGTGVRSRPSPVGNLVHLLSNMDVFTVVKAVSRHWSGKDRPLPLRPNDFVGNRHFLLAKERLRTWEWNMGKTPTFVEHFHALPSLDCLECKVCSGLIHSLSVDGMPCDALNLSGIKYDGKSLLEAVDIDAPVWLEDFARRVDGE